MQIIHIPKNENKLNFVYNILCTLIDSCKEFTFFNCTESPIDEYVYFDCCGSKCRKMKKEQPIKLINSADYLQNFLADGLNKQGYTLQHYVETCLLFELGEIKVVNGDFYEPNYRALCHYDIVATIEICPDGLDEIHIVGNADFLIRIHNLIN